MKAIFTFIGELNDFLPRTYRDTSFTLEFAPHQSLKHLIESLGIPHTDFGRVLVNGRENNANNRLKQSDQVMVFPADETLTSEARFILDNHLGQLATYLRMLGFDSLYRNDYQDAELARAVIEGGRVLLTRDRRLLMRKTIRLGYCIHQTDPRLQVVEVLRRFKLKDQIRPFQRCLRCNSLLQAVSKQQILERLEPLTKRYFEEFHICPSCHQIYWKGSHYGHMLEVIDELATQA
jgi:uncharacterized protein with PIN domain